MVFFRPHKHNTKYNELVTIKKITVVVGGIGGGPVVVSQQQQQQQPQSQPPQSSQTSNILSSGVNTSMISNNPTMPTVAGQHGNIVTGQPPS